MGIMFMFLSEGLIEVVTKCNGLKQLSGKIGRLNQLTTDCSQLVTNCNWLKLVQVFKFSKLKRSEMYEEIV